MMMKDEWLNSRQDEIVKFAVFVAIAEDIEIRGGSSHIREFRESRAARE